MKRLFALSLTAIAMLALAVPAVADTPTAKINRKWLLVTTNGNKTIEAGKTFKHCTQNHVKRIDARGEVSGATEGDKYKGVWRKDGTKIITFNHSWKKSSGKVTFSTLSTTSDNLPDGKFKVTVKQDGEALASSAISLKTTGDCG